MTEVTLSESAQQAIGERHEIARVSAGRRRINAVWEITQSIIAVAVTGTTLYVAGKLSAEGAMDSSAFLLLSNAFFLVIGFYFGRTNHTRMGGVSGQQLQER